MGLETVHYHELLLAPPYSSQWSSRAIIRKCVSRLSHKLFFSSSGQTVCGALQDIIWAMINSDSIVMEIRLSDSLLT